MSNDNDLDIKSSGISSLSLLIIFSLLLMVELLKGFLKYKKIRFITPAGGCILLGIFIGTIAYFLFHDRQFFNEFDHGIFRTILLPPIIFEAALSADKTQLRKRRLPILLFAIAGTFLSALFITLIVYMASSHIPNVPLLSFMECLLFGTVVSSVDPVTILSVLKSMEVPETELIYVLLLGESLFNDGVTVSMVDAVVDNFYRSEKIEESALIFWNLVKHFAVNTSVSITIGILTGIFSLIFFWGMKNKITPPMEVVCFFLWALIPHYLGEFFVANGIVSVATMAIFCDLYISNNQRLVDIREDDYDEEDEDKVVIMPNPEQEMIPISSYYTPTIALSDGNSDFDPHKQTPILSNLDEPIQPQNHNQGRVIFNLKALEYSEYLYDSDDEDDDLFYDNQNNNHVQKRNHQTHASHQENDVFYDHNNDDDDSINAIMSLPTYATQNILFGRFKYQMSPEAEEHVRFVAYIISQLAENSIFICMGLFLFTKDYEWNMPLVSIAIIACVTSRILIVFLLSNVVYVIHYQSQICCPMYDAREERYVSAYVTALRDRRTRLVLILAGIRGAVSLALMESTPTKSFVFDSTSIGDLGSANVVEGDDFYSIVDDTYSTAVSINEFLPLLRAMTTSTVLMSIFVFGGSSYRIFKRLGVYHEKDDLGGGYQL
jgi:NhaP-type Na+/H+ or K+/H+ antiporter